MSEILYHYTLLLNAFCFCELEYFTTRVFGLRIASDVVKVQGEDPATPGPMI